MVIQFGELNWVKEDMFVTVFRKPSNVWDKIIFDEDDIGDTSFDFILTSWTNHVLWNHNLNKICFCFLVNRKGSSLIK